MATRYRGSPAETLALDAYIKLMRAAHAVSARSHHHLKEHELTVGQFAVLEALHHLGPLAQRDLCGKLLTSAGNLTVVVTNLERRGLVERRRPAGDRRLVVVELSARGRQIVARVFPRHAAAVAEAFAALDPAEQATLGGLLRKLGLGGPKAPEPRGSP